MKLLKRKSSSFDIQVQDLTLHIQAGGDLHEESRAAALSFWEQLHAYTIGHPEIRASKRPIEVPADAPDIVREIIGAARRAGVGPMFSLQGAVADHVGRFLAHQVNDVTVNCGGDYFIVARRRQKLTVTQAAGGPVAVVVPPTKQGIGVAMFVGRGGRPPDGLAVLAESCMLADAVAAGVRAILPKENGFDGAMAYLGKIQGVFGAVVLLDGRIGVMGTVELAA